MPLTSVLYVGTDVSEKTNRTRFLDRSGAEIGLGFTSANDLPGSQGLAEEALRRAEAIGATEIAWAVEATNLFWWHLASFLTTHPKMVERCLKLYTFNPRVVAKFKESYGDLGKSDWVDAMVIADRLRFGRLPAECYLDERYQPLQRLTRYRRHLVGQIVREKQVVLGYIWLKLSAYHSCRPFTDTFGATSQVILERYLTPDEIVAAPLGELATLIAHKSHGLVADPEAVGRAVKEVAERSYRLSAKMAAPVNLVICSSLATIRTLAAQVRALDRAIAKELKDAPAQTLGTIPGLGAVFTAGIVAEVGDVRRFRDDNALAKFAGLTWRRYQSGQFEGQERPMTKTGNAYLRYYLVEAANLVRRFSPEYGSYYAKKLPEVTRHQHRRALALTARKLVRLVDSMLRSGQIYRPPAVRTAP
jgi:transposase